MGMIKMRELYKYKENVRDAVIQMVALKHVQLIMNVDKILLVILDMIWQSNMVMVLI